MEEEEEGGRRRRRRRRRRRCKFKSRVKAKSHKRNCVNETSVYCKMNTCCNSFSV